MMPKPSKNGWFTDEVKLQLTNSPSLRQKCQEANERANIVKILGARATSRKQAEAFINACDDKAQLDKLKGLPEKFFQDITDNSPGAIKKALADAVDPKIKSAYKVAANQQNAKNLQINTYLETIGQKYKEHLGGTTLALPVKADGEVIGVFYNNVEGRLPANGNPDYIEWYPKVGGKRSVEKRFFTREGGKTIWYTEGGTHGQTSHNDPPKWHKSNKDALIWEEF